MHCNFHQISLWCLQGYWKSTTFFCDSFDSTTFFRLSHNLPRFYSKNMFASNASMDSENVNVINISYILPVPSHTHIIFHACINEANLNIGWLLLLNPILCFFCGFFIIYTCPKFPDHTHSIEAICIRFIIYSLFGVSFLRVVQASIIFYVRLTLCVCVCARRDSMYSCMIS